MHACLMRCAKFHANDSFPTIAAKMSSPTGPLPSVTARRSASPYIVALMTEKLQLTGSERVLEVGTGSGYQTAILSRLAKEVFSIERIKPLLDVAFERLMDLGCRNVHFKLGDGSLGWPTSDSAAIQFDRILIAAATPDYSRGTVALATD